MVADWVINTPVDITASATTTKEIGAASVISTPIIEIITATRTIRAAPYLAIKLLAIGAWACGLAYAQGKWLYTVYTLLAVQVIALLIAFFGLIKIPIKR